MEKRSGYGAIVLGILVEIANWYQTTRDVIDNLRESGGLGGKTADVLLHPVFGLLLIVVGLLFIYRGGRGGNDGGSVTKQSQDGKGNVQIGGDVHGGVHIRHAAPPASVRVKYSSQQSIRFVGPHRASEMRMQLNLDNQARLGAFMPPQPWGITLLEQHGPLHVVHQPRPGTELPLDGNHVATFPGAATPGITMGPVMAGMTGQEITFDVRTSPAHRIRVDERSFIVRLDQINNRSTPQDPDLELVFSIVEE